MKIKLSFALFFFALFGIGVLNVQSQSVSLEIKNRDGSEKNIDINGLRKITFGNGIVILNYRSGSMENVVTSSIQKMVFASFTGFNDHLTDAETPVVYPNPAKEFISIKNIPGNSTKIIIYSITGSQMIQLQLYASNEMIDISHLSRGIYIIKVNNKALKFTKL
jgi:hypothetical protein